MPNPLPVALRQRAVDAYLRGEGTRAEIAERFQVGVASLGRWVRKHRETGSVEPMPHNSGPEPMLDDEALKVLLAIVEEENDLTNEEYALRLVDETGIAVSRTTILRAFKRLGITRKKRRSLQRNVDANASLRGVNATYIGSNWSTRGGSSS